MTMGVAYINIGKGTIKLNTNYTMYNSFN